MFFFFAALVLDGHVSPRLKIATVLFEFGRERERETSKNGQADYLPLHSPDVRTNEKWSLLPKVPVFETKKMAQLYIQKYK